MERELFDPLHANRRRMHGPNNAAAVIYATDDPAGQGAWLQRLGIKAGPVAHAQFGEYMLAVVGDLPHGWRKLLEGLRDSHLDAGSVKMTVIDAIARLLYPPPGFVPLDLLRRGKTAMPHRSDSTNAQLEALLPVDVGALPEGASRSDLALAVCAERIVRSGSPAGVAPVALAYFQVVSAAGLAAALPWSLCVDVAVFKEVIEHGVKAFNLDPERVAELAGQPAPPRLVLDRFVANVLEPGAPRPPMKNHLDILSGAWGSIILTVTDSLTVSVSTDNQ
jgi:hypothetical protein